MCCEDGKLPGLSLIAWESGHSACGISHHGIDWDSIPLQVRRPKDLLVMLRTKEKYVAHTTSCILPVCIESLGGWSESTKSFIGAKVRDAIGESNY